MGIVHRRLGDIPAERIGDLSRLRKGWVMNRREDQLIGKAEMFPHLVVDGLGKCILRVNILLDGMYT